MSPLQVNAGRLIGPLPRGAAPPFLVTGRAEIHEEANGSITIKVRV